LESRIILNHKKALGWYHSIEFAENAAGFVLIKPPWKLNRNRRGKRDVLTARIVVSTNDLAH